MSDYDDDSVTNNLRDSANGTFVSLDDFSPLTGYEPNAMETPATSLTSRIPLDCTTPSSDLYIDDDELGMLLAEARDCADYRRAEGVNVSQSSMSVMVDRTGEPVEKSDSDHFPCSVRNVKSAQSQFPSVTQPTGGEGGSVEERIAEERASSSAQIRTVTAKIDYR